MTTWEALDKARECDRLADAVNHANRRTIRVGFMLVDAVKTLEVLAEPISPLASDVEVQHALLARPAIAAEAAARAYDAMGGYPFTDPR